MVFSGSTTLFVRFTKGCVKVEDFNYQILLGQSPWKKSPVVDPFYKTQSEICDIFCHLLSQYEIFEFLVLFTTFLSR